VQKFEKTIIDSIVRKINRARTYVEPKAINMNCVVRLIMMFIDNVSHDKH